MVTTRPLLSAAFVAKARAIAVEHAGHCGTVVDLCDAYEAATERTERQRISHEIAAILHTASTAPVADRFRAAHRDDERPEALDRAVRALRAALAPIARSGGKAVA